MDMKVSIASTIMILTVLFIFGMVTMKNGNTQTATGRLVHAPEFPTGREWLNVDRPLTMQELRGRLVLLDFWTYCCINCMHVLPDLERLEDKYGDRLVVVGVHSAKFESERDIDNIRDAVMRYGIRHPVINDADFNLWNRYGVNSWPTLVLIDPDGYVVGQASGEGNFDVFDRIIGSLLEGHEVNAAGLDPLPLKRENATQAMTELRYPGKVYYDEASGRLFVADSGHNRILAVDPATGDIQTVIGSGETGLADGTFKKASFSNPQGMMMVGGTLYIADTDNHALRAADLEAGTVRTIAGDGGQAEWGAKGGAARLTRLNSPWDLTYLGGKLYIAMAGSHQLWVYDPEGNTIEPFAGSGRENIVDANLQTASLAQPSGITTNGHDLFFADSETSSIRTVAMSRRRVETLVGTGLFDFGFKDGALGSAQLQHPLGIVWGDGALWIADTYNNRIRRIDERRRTITTVAGGDGDGLADGAGDVVRFDEPGGLSYANGKLYVADTNNHALRVVDTTTGNVTTLDLIPSLTLATGGEYRVTVHAPAGFHITTDAPSEISAVRQNGDRREIQPVRIDASEWDVTAVFAAPEAGNRVRMDFTGTLYVCPDEGTVCYMRPFDFSRALRFSDGDETAREVLYRVSPPEE